MALIVDIVRSVLCTSWLNLLLFFVPIGYVAYFLNINSTLIFIFNALAIVPLSSLLTDVTEKIASDAGDTVGAILNISLGNLVELILFVALKNDQIRVVQASILGSILVNLLLILGSALLTTKLPDQEFLHDAAGTQLLGSLLFVSVFTFLMPTAFDHTFRGTDGAEAMSLKMSRISAVMILLIYILYFIHEIKTRTPPHDLEAATHDEENDDATLFDGQDHPTHVSFGPRTDRIISYVMLILTSTFMSVSAEFLASAIDDVIRQGHLSESLIGLIIMPIVGNVAEYATVVVVAARDNMGLALAVSVGSSIQIALCVTPLTVIAGWIMDRPLMLTFNLFEIATLFGSVLLVNFLILGEGVSGPLRSSGLKGGLMCACYVIIG
ncbi:Ca2+ transporter [Trichoderma reesei QM6a]|uniref:Vacuolar calcium ion transporter n=1 Tax=Hypocrea jecorina (strain QM6a) TaxID=431241 RepID=G0RBQ1_HYPJQ|nr:Ca2+ transporter [Trichoderma reesei QM6a]EGR51369.1 Ca2+ transporter [Trichoderma reesei QM6a]